MSNDGKHLIRKQLSELAQLRPHIAPKPLPIRNINLEMEKRLTVGQRTADAVANSMGSWRFILIQSGLLALWIFC